MPATPAWLATAESMFNRSLDSSAEAGVLARRLEGTSLQVEVRGITRIRAATFGGRLALSAAGDGAAGDGAAGDSAAGDGAAHEGAADATISGSPAALLKLLSGRGAPGKPGAEIRGDAEIANLYRELLLLARPDPEEELSRWVGDFPARRLAQFAQQALGFARRARRTFGENIAEYLQEEGRDLVNRTELDEFLRGVDLVRESADRIDARLGRLEQRLQGS